ncbi:hypothetical protein D3C76_1476760 [compost metagenome]
MGSDEFEVWPDNWQALGVFMSMGTQWRTGMTGATGLDYGVLPDVMRLRGVPKADRAEVFDWIMLMEREALGQMREKS